MSNKNKNHSKKWLISRIKTSGSKKKWVESDDYADTRNSKRNEHWDDLPKKEGMGKSRQFYNGKVNYGLLVRFLRGHVGEDWEALNAEILDRIPTNLYQYRDCVEWFVADLIEEREDGLWDKRAQEYLLMDKSITGLHGFDYSLKEFYVSPQDGKLCRVADAPTGKVTKGMSAEELRQFRECQQQEQLEERRERDRQKIEEEEFRDLLKKGSDETVD